MGAQSDPLDKFEMHVQRAAIACADLACLRVGIEPGEQMNWRDTLTQQFAGAIREQVEKLLHPQPCRLVLSMEYGTCGEVLFSKELNLLPTKEKDRSVVTAPALSLNRKGQ